MGEYIEIKSHILTDDLLGIIYWKWAQGMPSNTSQLRQESGKRTGYRGDPEGTYSGWITDVCVCMHECTWACAHTHSCSHVESLLDLPSGKMSKVMALRFLWCCPGPQGNEYCVLEIPSSPSGLLSRQFQYPAVSTRFYYVSWNCRPGRVGSWSGIPGDPGIINIC